MKKRVGKVVSYLFLLFFPFISEAKTIADIAKDILGVINPIAKIMIGLGLVYFFFNLGKYAYSVEEKKKEEAKSTIIYSIIGMFVLVSVWGIVDLVAKSLGLI